MGHADLLVRRRSIAGALEDPRTDPALRGKLSTADSARRFAFERMDLKRTGAFSSFVSIDRSAVTYLVSASPRTRLEAYRWWFPIVGSFPYKGYFVKKRALAERDRLEKAGLDAAVSGAAAYKTPLPFSDPLPSSALSLSTGALAALLIHELAHGTVYFKNQSEFNEAAAEFIGRKGAAQYMAERFGPDSPELADYRRELADDEKVDQLFARLRAKLQTLYAETVVDADKLSRREALFAQAKSELSALGVQLHNLNNAVVVAHGVYHSDLPFQMLLDSCGGDWWRFIVALKALDSADPAGALRRQWPRGEASD